MAYYKFLMEDGRSPYRFFDWPKPTWDDRQGVWVPGSWVEAIGELRPCGNGIHACRPRDIPWWTQEGAFALEYAQEPRVYSEVWDETKVYGRKARLLRPLPAWNDPAVWWSLVLDLIALIPEFFTDDQGTRELVGAWIEALHAVGRSARIAFAPRRERIILELSGGAVEIMAVRAVRAALSDALYELAASQSRDFRRVTKIASSILGRHCQWIDQAAEWDRLSERIGQVIVARIDPEAHDG